MQPHHLLYKGSSSAAGDSLTGPNGSFAVATSFEVATWLVFRPPLSTQEALSLFGKLRRDKKPFAGAEQKRNKQGILVVVQSCHFPVQHFVGVPHFLKKEWPKTSASFLFTTRKVQPQKSLPGVSMTLQNGSTPLCWMTNHF